MLLEKQAKHDKKLQISQSAKQEKELKIFNANQKIKLHIHADVFTG